MLERSGLDLQGATEQFLRAEGTLFIRSHVLRLLNHAVSTAEEPSWVGLKLARAYRMELAFQKFWTLPPEWSDSWIRVAQRLKGHWDGVLRWFRSRASRDILEAMNSLVPAAKARACGHRTTDNFITMAYLVCGKLNI